ncbi:MAG TPA: hypothetical protein VJ982_00035 [Gemmatimonadota bacterium]|nr:hypothetical protein [Gemmatimonadota bacterium]
MTFIDWSNPEEMLGLLSEYVADARNDSAADPARERSLDALLRDLMQLTRGSDGITVEETIDGLHRIHESHVENLAGDPVLVHVGACIEELERIRAESDV